jgi:hypothetical protein
MAGLTNSEIMKIVNRYIGVSGGYLGDFTYRTHAEFYEEYCDLDINPYQYEGTTRDKFIAILKSASPEDQAKMLGGVLEKFPIVPESVKTRTQGLQDEIRGMIKRLEDATSAIDNPSLKITSIVVERAIKDAECLLQTSGASSSVDRLHTALHGYLKAVCADAGIRYEEDATTSRLFRLLRQNHPALQKLGARQSDIEKILQCFGTIIDVMNPIRNKASIAHPNENLLEKDEALLVINASKTILHYLDAKMSISLKIATENAEAKD